MGLLPHFRHYLQEPESVRVRTVIENYSFDLPVGHLLHAAISKLVNNGKKNAYVVQKIMAMKQRALSLSLSPLNIFRVKFYITRAHKPSDSVPSSFLMPFLSPNLMDFFVSIKQSSNDNTHILNLF